MTTDAIQATADSMANALGHAEIYEHKRALWQVFTRDSLVHVKASAYQAQDHIRVHFSRLSVPGDLAIAICKLVGNYRE